METPDPIHSYDYSEDGRIIKSCNNESCRICDDTIIHITPTIRARVSNHFKHDILDVLCNKGLNFSYKSKSDIYKILKDKDIFSSFSLAEAIFVEVDYLKINLSFNFILDIIFSKLPDINKNDCYC